MHFTTYKGSKRKSYQKLRSNIQFETELTLQLYHNQAFLLLQAKGIDSICTSFLFIFPSFFDEHLNKSRKTRVFIQGTWEVCQEKSLRRGGKLNHQVIVKDIPSGFSPFVCLQPAFGFSLPVCIIVDIATKTGISRNILFLKVHMRKSQKSVPNGG